MPLPYLACMLATAQFYHLPPRVLPTLQAIEAGRPGIVSPNTNGTADFGVMQINSIWIPALASISRLTQTALRDRLISDACFNIAAAGVIMRVYLNEAHGDILTAVGYYHSHTPEYAEAYRAKVMRMAQAMFGQATSPPR